MRKTTKPAVGRRGFLKGAAAGAAAGAAGLVSTPSAKAQAPETRGAAPPSAAQVAAERNPAAGAAQKQFIERPGADYMVDVIKSLGIEYFIANPGSSFRGIHESLVSYGGNKPEFITCNHEEIAAAMCNGYAKIEGKPAVTAVHGTVGMQHAAMAVYNAYCDQAPMILLAGNRRDGSERRSYVEWVHSVQDAAAMVRDYSKWDDNPGSLEHWGESMVRGYQLANTAPRMPVVLVCDEDLQEDAYPEHFKGHIPKLGVHNHPAGDASAVNEVARMLVAAENPVLVAGLSARTPNGTKLLVELAELLQCAVIDQKRRMNFPNRNPLNQTLRQRAAIAEADLIVGLEVWDFFGVVHALGGRFQTEARSLTKPGAKLVSITASDLFFKSNYQTFFRNTETDLAIAGDSEATLPSLIEAVKRLMTEDKKRAFAARGVKLGESFKQALEQQRTAASYGWDASPISTARLSMEVWNKVKNEDWSLVSDSFWVSNWPQRLWDMSKHYHYIGGAGGEGVGYLAGATVGAALANKKYGRLSVSIQSDGDLMYGPGALWTAAHHRIPMLILMHNNRAYHQEIMQLQHMAGLHNRGFEECGIGTTITDPNIDYAKLASSMGVESYGPVTNPADLGPAIARGIEVVKRGNPYLIDVVTQGR
jgi:thiamine pyrophosphate-dependent acetolactate synthase large subunit-like protein